MTVKIDYATFLKRAKEKHGDFYDYSLAEKGYTKFREKVPIICPVHGKFTQRAAHHTLGSGCRKCSADLRGGNMRFTQEEFIQKALQKHNGKYSYDEVVYKGANIKVAIRCPEHGLFGQKPGQHLFGTGCPKCAHNYSANKSKLLAEKDEITVIAPTWGIPKRK